MVRQAYNMFQGDSTYLVLFYIALLYAFIADRKLRELLVYPSLTVMVIAFMPVTAKIIAEYIIGAEVYWRVFWLLPIIIVIAYAATHMIMSRKKASSRSITFLVLLLLIALSGKFILTGENFEMPENYFKIPNEAIFIAEMIKEDKGTDIESAAPKLAVPYELACTIRQYDASIPLLFGRRPHDSRSEGSVEVYETINSANPDIEKIAEIARRNRCGYIVLAVSQQPLSSPEDSGYIEVGRTGKYILYKDGTLF